MNGAYINGPRDVNVTVATPSDPETDPAVIEALHRQLVADAVAGGVTDLSDLSGVLCLPKWNVERALYFLRTGEDWVFPTMKKPRRKAHQHPVVPGKFKPFKNLKPRKFVCRPKKKEKPKSTRGPGRPRKTLEETIEELFPKSRDGRSRK